MSVVLKINTQPVGDDEYAAIRSAVECVFCSPPYKKILAESENFYVTYDASPLLEGHVDIHTKSHIGCSGEIEPELLGEFISLKAWVGELITDLYGAVSFFEHGRAGHCSLSVDGVECNHFHMHALPLTEDISAKVSAKFMPILLESESNMPVLYERYDQYLYFENTSGEKFFFPCNKPLPSHYLRSVIANAIGRPERADWETYGDKEALNAFKTRLSRHE